MALRATRWPALLFVVGMLSACATPQTDTTDTDEFLQNAFTTYGVIAGTTYAGAPNATANAPGAPLDIRNLPQSGTQPATRSANTLTKAQVCDGRYGVQTRYKDASTGQPIDCGPAPASRSTSTPLTKAQVCEGKTGVQTRYKDANTGQPIDCGTAT